MAVIVTALLFSGRLALSRRTWVLSLVPALLVSIALQGCRKTERHYGAIIDAGSSNSRLIIFEWHVADKLPHVSRLASKHCPQNSKCPVTNFEHGMDTNTCDGLKEIAKEAHAAAVKSHGQLPPIPLWVWATGGVRWRNEATRGKAGPDIMRHTDACLRGAPNYALNYALQGVGVIPGYKEGAYAWLAVKYLDGTLRGMLDQPEQPDSQGIVELGGESAQVAYRIDSKSTFTVINGVDEAVDQDVLKRFPNLHIYAISYLSRGIDAASKGIDASSQLPASPPKVCGNAAPSATCISEIQKLLCPTVFRPGCFRPPRFRGGSGSTGPSKFIGLSRFASAMQNMAPPNDTLEVAAKTAKQVCGPGGTISLSPNSECFNTLYAHQLVTAWDINPDIVVPQSSSQAAEPSLWALGAMIVEAAK